LVTAWLPTELHLTLEVYAKLRKTSKSDVVREALKEYFQSRFTAADAYAVILGSRKAEPKAVVV
jgi:Arc/MetJ-type ribon-helix-helix transcriptional regulator